MTSVTIRRRKLAFYSCPEKKRKNQKNRASHEDEALAENNKNKKQTNKKTTVKTYHLTGSAWPDTAAS